MRKVLLSILSILLIVTSCSSYFYGGLTGAIVDESDGSNINNALIALYFNKDTRDFVYDNYDKANHAVFSGESADFVATSTNGSYSFSKAQWVTNNPTFGKEGDKANIYFLIYHEDYGLSKYDPAVTLSSESTSTIPDIRLTSIVDSYSYTVNLREVLSTTGSEISESDSLSDTVSFRYSYIDYRGIRQQGDVAAAGSYTFSVNYYTDTEDAKIPTITLSDFECANNEVNGSTRVEQYSIYSESDNSLVISDNSSYTIDLAKTDEGSSRREDFDIYFVKNYFTASISGSVVNSTGAGLNEAVVSLSFNPATASGSYNTNVTASIATPQTESTSAEEQTGEGRLSGQFSNLCSDVVFFIDWTNVAEIKPAAIDAIVKANYEGTDSNTETITLNSNQRSYTVRITHTSSSTTAAGA